MTKVSRIKKTLHGTQRTIKGVLDTLLCNVKTLTPPLHGNASYASVHIYLANTLLLQTSISNFTELPQELYDFPQGFSASYHGGNFYKPERSI